MRKTTTYREPRKAPDPQPKIKGASSVPKGPRDTGVADKAPYGKGRQKKGA